VSKIQNQISETMPPNARCALLDLSGSFPSSSKFNGAEDFLCAIFNSQTGRQTPPDEQLAIPLFYRSVKMASPVLPMRTIQRTSSTTFTPQKFSQDRSSPSCSVRRRRNGQNSQALKSLPTSRRIYKAGHIQTHPEINLSADSSGRCQGKHSPPQ
jgi:hypothetical protein